MRRSWLLVAAAALAVVAIVVVSGLLWVRSLTTFAPFDGAFATAQVAMPAGATCAGGKDESIGVAREVLHLGRDTVYVAGGTNPVPPDEWEDARFRLPVIKNSTRNLLFQGSCFFRSPGVPAGCVGDACFRIEEFAGYTWLALSEVAGQSCVPNADGCRLDVVDPGHMSVTTTRKCHRIVFEGPALYELSDGVGNTYVMHATATGIPDLAPSLPAGWTLRKRAIDEPLVLLPNGEGDDCYFNIVRDNLVQAYHQVGFADDVWPPGRDVSAPTAGDPSVTR